MASADAAVKGLDVRVTRIERLLPELATKKDLAAAIKPLATKAELTDLRNDVRGVTAELRGEIAQLRGDMKSLAPRALVEDLQSQIKLVMEVVVAHHKATDELREEMREGFRNMDRRMMKLEGRMARLEGAD